MRKQLASTPLFWRVFWGNAAVLVVVVLSLVFGPLQISAPLTLTESISLIAGVVLALAISLVLMRPAFRPFDELADHMRRHDPLVPGERVDGEGGPKVTALALAFNEMLDRLEFEQRESTRRALRVQEGERQRVARELHDVLAHSLSALALQLEGTRLLARDRDADPEVVEGLERAHHLAVSGLTEARQAISALRGDELPALEDLAGTFPNATLTVTGTPRDASSEARLALYRTAQEALTNVRRHSASERVELKLVYEEDGTTLTVQDHGAAAPVIGGRGYGLTGMRERAELLGGRLNAGPTDDGFRVELWLPA
jgi:signal transduction histidine kinase